MASAAAAVSHCDYVRELSGLDTAPLRDFLDACTQPFEASALYAINSQERLVDTSKRL
jgi:hypothetical protein